MTPDSLINSIIPTTDSLKAAIMDDYGWYKISTYCNVEGDSWMIQLLTTFIGTAVGGVVAAVASLIVQNYQARKQLLREVSRDEMLEKFEKKRAALQKELEEHRDKRQNTWNLLQTMQEFASYILDADKYAALNVDQQMQYTDARDSILFLGRLIDKIESLWHQNVFLLNDDVSQSIKKIFDWMNAYKLLAMQCTMCAPKKGQPIVPPIQQRRVEECFSKCKKLRSLWNAEWDRLRDYMKRMRQEQL